MKTIDLYTRLREAARNGERGYALYRNDPALRPLEPLMRSWGMDVESTREWLASPEAIAQDAVAHAYLQQAPEMIRHIESAFGGNELPGVVILAPSYAEFDGFARYDRGGHTVLMGVDFPGADVDYLRALTAHELSHVFRDHAPEVWGHLGKPLSQISRAEYLEASTAQEHLVSEGLATLFSQLLLPGISAATHHFYEEEEWQWCESNAERVEQSLLECLRRDADVWSYYAESRIAPGRPSRTQYYWAARRLADRLGTRGPDALAQVVEWHRRAADFFEEFR